MTEPGTAGADVRAETLGLIARASGHELRNALNALVVNLEVVRSRITDPATQPFADQAVEQCEESVRLAEASIALLNLVIGAVGPDGLLRCSANDSGGIRILAAEGEAERAVRSLKGLAARGVISVDTSDTTVILSIPAQPHHPTTE